MSTHIKSRHWFENTVEELYYHKIQGTMGKVYEQRKKGGSEGKPYTLKTVIHKIRISPRIPTL